MNAREFLAHQPEPFLERDLLKQPLSEAEVRSLAARLGGIRELVGPKRREELAGLSDAALVVHLARTPGHLRRPLIDTGTVLTAGFTAATRARLGGAAGKVEPPAAKPKPGSKPRSPR